MISPLSNPIVSRNGSVASIITERMPPEIRPNVRTVFFMWIARREWKLEFGLRLGYRCVFRVILSGDFSDRWRKSFFRGVREACADSPLFNRMLRDQAELLPDLHGLRPSLRRELVEQAARVSLHRVFAHEQLLGNLAVAQSGGDQLEDLELAGRDSPFS